jgi:molybdate transport system ATP-binding protein
MREGEHWAILGGNGAGKSTFLKLILGELQPAHGGTVQRFGLTPRHSVWDLKKRLGYVSTELQAGYPELATGAEVVASGFTSSVGLRCGATRRQRWKVRARLKDFDLTHLAKAPIAAMSYGEVRKLLLLRALVHEPRVLLLDEPFDGLDTRAKAAFNRTLDRVARNGTQLIMVTHRLHDLPRCTTHALLLDAGRIVQQGPLGER